MISQHLAVKAVGINKQKQIKQTKRMSSQVVVEKWNNQVAWAKDSEYKVRCTDATFGESKSSGNPMITLKHEVAGPETMNSDGKEYLIAGVSAGLTTYYPTKVLDGNGGIDEVKTANAQERVKTLYRAFDLPDTNINFDNPDLSGFKGKVVWALLEDDATEQRRSPTREQLAKGIRQGDILKNPKTGKPLMQHYPKIRDIYGTAPTDANKPY